MECRVLAVIIRLLGAFSSGLSLFCKMPTPVTLAADVIGGITGAANERATIEFVIEESLLQLSTENTVGFFYVLK